MIRHLCQCLGGRDTDAHRDSHPLADTPDQLRTQDFQFFLVNAVHTQVCLVDGIDFDFRDRCSKYRHHPRRQIAVKRVIGRTDNEISAFDLVPDLEERGTHLDTHRLALIASGHHASVIVGQNHNGLSFQFRLESPFARNEKIVAID